MSNEQKVYMMLYEWEEHRRALKGPEFYRFKHPDGKHIAYIQYEAYTDALKKIAELEEQHKGCTSLAISCDKLQADLQEQCRINALGQERELKLITENERLKSEIKSTLKRGTI